MNKPYDELMKEVEILKTQNEAYRIQLEDSQIDCENWMGLYAHKSKQYDMLDQEFEESVRGDFMNLELVKKYLDKVKPTAKTKDEYLKAMNIIDKDISNLDKFVEERWGHGEEE